MIGPHNLGSNNSRTPSDLATAKAIHDEVSDEELKIKRDELEKTTIEKRTNSKRKKIQIIKRKRKTCDNLR